MKWGAGVYVTGGGVPESEPLEGLETMEKVSGAFSGSLPVSVIAFGVSSAVLTPCAWATGGWFAGAPARPP